MRSPIDRRIPVSSVTIALALVAGSCANINRTEAQDTVRVFKYAGSVQCTGGGSDLPTIERQLTDGGLKVLSAACATDGRMRMAMCGANDGRLAIFEISGSDAESASKLGFIPLSKLPDAKVASCQ